ncbi:MAG: hypothetical protein AABX59_02795 [Nanoarchaeota archaeon]
MYYLCETNKKEEERMEQLVCGRCGQKTSIGMLKVDLRNKKLVCGNCFSIQEGVKEKAKEVLIMQPEGPLGRGVLREGKFEYSCGYCNFRFKGKREFETCPYCSNNKLVLVRGRRPGIVKEIDEFM